MFKKNKLTIFKIYDYLSFKRKKQFKLLFFSTIISGFFEAFSIASAIPFLALLSSPENIFDIYILKEVANFLKIDSPNQLFLASTLLFCVVVFFSTVFRLFNIWFISYFTAKLEIDLSYELFKKNLYQNYIDFTNRNSSEIISLLIEKINLCVSAINAFIRSIASLIIAFSILISLLIINWKVVLVIILLVALYYLFISLMTRQLISKNSFIEAKLAIQLIRIVQESFGAFRDIAINNTQEIRLNSFLKKVEKMKFINVLSSFLNQFPRYILEALVLITLIIVAYTLNIVSNDLSFITLLGSFVFGAQKLLPAVQQIYGGWVGYQSKKANLSYVLDELNKKSIIVYKKSKANLSINQFSSLSLKNVFFSYKNNKVENYALKKVNLDIKKGDYVGIYGQTGAGKSTLIDLLMGLLKADKGSMFFNDIDLYKGNNLFEWRNLIAHVPQDTFLKEGTIEDNIIFDNSNKDIKENLLMSSLKIANIYNFVESLDLGIKTIVGERGIRLSGGQKQRISIARAIYQNKKILVLDEATSALDEITEKNVVNAIRNFDKEITIIMVTHRTKTLLNCNRIFKVINGSIIENREN